VLDQEKDGNIIQFPAQYQVEDDDTPESVAEIITFPIYDGEIRLGMNVLDNMQSDFEQRLQNNDNDLRHVFSNLFGCDGDTVFDIVRDALNLDEEEGMNE
jgi:hypothetical protein